MNRSHCFLEFGDGQVRPTPSASDIAAAVQDVSAGHGQFAAVREDGSFVKPFAGPAGLTLLCSGGEVSLLLESQRSDLSPAQAADVLHRFVAGEDWKAGLAWHEPKRLPGKSLCVNGRYYRHHFFRGFECVEAATVKKGLRRVLRVELAIVVAVAVLMTPVVVGIVIAAKRWLAHAATLNNDPLRFWPVTLTCLVPLLVVHFFNWRCPLCNTRIGFWPGQRCHCSKLTASVK